MGYTGTFCKDGINHLCYYHINLVYFYDIVHLVEVVLSIKLQTKKKLQRSSLNIALCTSIAQLFVEVYAKLAAKGIFTRFEDSWDFLEIPEFLKDFRFFQDWQAIFHRVRVLLPYAVFEG